MYNILEVEDKIKGFPDQALMKEAQFPSGDVPQFLIVSELQRRNEMRKSYAAMQEPTQTVPIAQQVVAEARQGVAGMMGGNPMLPPPMQAQAPMQAPMQPPMQPPMQRPMQPPMAAPMAAPQAPAGIVGMQDGRTAPRLSGRMNRPSALSARAESQLTREEKELAARIMAQRNLDYVRSLSNPDGVTEYLGNYIGVPYGQSMDQFEESPEPPIQINTDAFNLPISRAESVITDPPPSPPPNPELAGYNAGIMDLTKEGRDFITTQRNELSAIDPYTATFTERNYITDDIDRQSYIDRLSSVAGEDLASREGLIDELQEKSKKDALSAFLMSFGAGVAGGDLSGGLEKGSKAAQDIKQIADKRLFDERKSMRDVKSAAEREAIQLGLSAEEAGLAGRRAEQKFGADQEALRNTVEFQNYQTSRQILLDNISGAREDVTTIATLIKNEADIVNDANRIRADMAREAGTERRSIRDYIGDLVKAQRDTLEASVAGLTDPSSITKLVDGYRTLLEKELGLPSSNVTMPNQTAVDELVDTAGFSIN
jgi:hypothetical protein